MPARLCLLALLAFAALAQVSASLFHQVDDMVATLVEITGWQVKDKIPSEMLSNARFRTLVESGMKKANNDQEVRATELTLKMFGFVPQDFNLVREAVDVVSEQAAAFYDYKKQRLFILDSTPPGFEREVALVHELAHGLADQHHHLGKYLRHGSPDDDAATAREAVMEGQATWLTWTYVAKRKGRRREVPVAGADGAGFPVFSTAPLYVRESLTFPYNEGMKFQEALYQKLGRQAFDEVFEHPPVSTQQILHPEIYLAGRKPVDPEPPSPVMMFGKDANRFRLLAQGTLGEFDHSVLLRTYIAPAEGIESASHWRGSSFRLYENKRDKYAVLAYSSQWDSAEAAHAFFVLYERVLKGKWKRTEIADESDAEVSGTGDNGRFRLRVSGATVESIEGLR